MKIEIKEARLEDCGLLAAELDEAGVNLIKTGWNVEPKDGLEMSFKTSEICRTAFIDGKAAAMYGCTSQGLVWLTTSPAIEKAKIKFIREARKFINFIGRWHKWLECFVHEDNTRLRFFLSTLGFVEIYKVGKAGEFRQCVWRRH